MSRPPTPVPVADDPLARERSHLAGSRAALRAMREDAESLDIKDVTANWVNAEVLARQIGERIKSLADLSDTPSSSAAWTTCTPPAPTGRKAPRASASTSAAGTSTTTTVTRW